MEKITFIYFDIGGVMLRWEGGLTQLAKRHNQSVENVLSVFRHYEDDFCRGVYTEKEMWQKYHTDLKLQDAEDFAYIEFCVSHFTIIEETHELVRKLAKDYKIGLLTNLQPDTFAHIMRNKQVPDIEYAAIVQSCVVGHIKPEPAIYHIAQQRAGVAPHEILFIDDLPQNITTAKALGWHGYVFDKMNPKKSIQAVKELLKNE